MIRFAKTRPEWPVYSEYRATRLDCGVDDSRIDMVLVGLSLRVPYKSCRAIPQSATTERYARGELQDKRALTHRRRRALHSQHITANFHQRPRINQFAHNRGSTIRRCF